MTELLEVPREEVEVGVREQPEDQRRPELNLEPDQDIPILPEDPEVIAEREGVHERIQSKIQHKDKEAAEEVMSEVPPEWNAVPDLIIEDEEVMMITETDSKRKRDEVACERRKWRKEDDIFPEKYEHSPTVSRRTQYPAEYYICTQIQLGLSILYRSD